ncbi:MAG: prepilin-type N-terminal cleavage/methylation domain-containing protein [Candidatus Omnitrophica bacterium]|nr:prepilin-type N-terminal cleavage/methylation domain-containing protein [Candidatus Omnitrophota bacterium]
MKDKKGISLLEIVVATLILSITMAGLVNVFISGKCQAGNWAGIFWTLFIVL